MLSLLILIPVILAIFILRRKPLLCLRNFAVAGVVLPLVAGTFLFPTSLRFDILNVPNQALFELSYKKTILFVSLGLTSFILSIFFLDVVFAKSKKKFTFPVKTVRLIERFREMSLLKTFTILAVFTVAGLIPLFAVFYNTGYIPLCNFEPVVSDKYFRGLTAAYIPLRPFYALGQNVLAVTSSFIMLYIFSEKSVKRTLLFIPLFVATFFGLLLTAKRGELVFPFVMLIGSFILLVKINRFDIFRIALMLVLVSYLVVVLDPVNKRPVVYKMCSYTYTLLKKVPPAYDEDIMKGKSGLDVRGGMLKFAVNAFGIQIRETTRLFYHFEDKNERFLHGKTFIAGLLSFIPTSVFPFKEKYYFGRVTLRLWDANPETSGGPNIGLIGESYVNFGSAGVIILPILIGGIVWFLDRFYVEITQKDSFAEITSMCFLFFLLYHLVFIAFQVGSSTMQAFIIRTVVIGSIGFLLFSWHKSQISEQPT